MFGGSLDQELRREALIDLNGDPHFLIHKDNMIYATLTKEHGYFSYPKFNFGGSSLYELWVNLAVYCPNMQSIALTCNATIYCPNALKVQFLDQDANSPHQLHARNIYKYQTIYEAGSNTLSIPFASPVIVDLEKDWEEEMLVFINTNNAPNFTLNGSTFSNTARKVLKKAWPYKSNDTITVIIVGLVSTLNQLQKRPTYLIITKNNNNNYVYKHNLTIQHLMQQNHTNITDDNHRGWLVAYQRDIRLLIIQTSGVYVAFESPQTYKNKLISHGREQIKISGDQVLYKNGNSEGIIEYEKDKHIITESAKIIWLENSAPKTLDDMGLAKKYTLFKSVLTASALAKVLSTKHSEKKQQHSETRSGNRLYIQTERLTSTYNCQQETQDFLLFQKTRTIFYKPMKFIPLIYKKDLHKPLITITRSSERTLEWIWLTFRNQGVWNKTTNETTRKAAKQFLQTIDKLVNIQRLNYTMTKKYHLPLTLAVAYGLLTFTYNENIIYKIDQANEHHKAI